MDPLSQGALGATAATAAGERQELRKAAILGFLAGMAPDLDVLIRSSTDPLLFLEYHRQFTHALVFIPVGGIVCALLLHGLFGRRWRLPFRRTAFYCTLGYATHALLDACTTYGTQLLWPFSDARIAWNTISIIDPIYTLPILALVIVASLRRRPRLAQLALAWALAYPMLGVVQRERAEQLGWELAAERGHDPLRLEAKPSFANILLWKVVYETADRFHVDAIRVGLADSTVFEGGVAAKLDLERDFPWLDHRSQQATDIERFRWFSNGYVAVDAREPNRIVDIRYSMVPNRIEALWGIQLDPRAASDEHAAWRNTRESGRERASELWDMLLH